MSNPTKEFIPHLVCPKCLSVTSNPESHSAYHNRTNYVCPCCGYVGDSTEFETSYEFHPIHKLSSRLVTPKKLSPDCETPFIHG